MSLPLNAAGGPAIGGDCVNNDRVFIDTTAADAFGDFGRRMRDTGHKIDRVL